MFFDCIQNRNDAFAVMKTSPDLSDADMSTLFLVTSYHIFERVHVLLAVYFKTLKQYFLFDVCRHSVYDVAS